MGMYYTVTWLASVFITINIQVLLMCASVSCINSN